MHVNIWWNNNVLGCCLSQPTLLTIGKQRLHKIYSMYIYFIRPFWYCKKHLLRLRKILHLGRFIIRCWLLWVQPNLVQTLNKDNSIKSIFFLIDYYIVGLLNETANLCMLKRCGFPVGTRGRRTAVTRDYLQSETWDHETAARPLYAIMWRAFGLWDPVKRLISIKCDLV